ncbi:uncharacterized protein LOC144304574 isoform X2 [Canis aureus]
MKSSLMKGPLCRITKASCSQPARNVTPLCPATFLIAFMEEKIFRSSCFAALPMSPDERPFEEKSKKSVPTNSQV